jgi:hypothetical protein
MTVMLNLEQPGLDALQQEAADLGVSVEQLANEIIRRHVRSRTATVQHADATAFRNAMTESMTENEELLRRLAK